MVLRSVHKPYAVVGLLVAAICVPTACSDEFEGCEASRTCPAPGDDDSGSGGEAGGGKEAGGSSGSSAGSSGAAGMDDGDRGGTGGSSGSGASGGEGGADGEPPTVEAFTPSDGSVDVERDIEVTVRLSEPIDESTVTETSATLVGPDGEVAGSLSVDENVISFVPDRSLYLLGTYTFTIDETIADLAGNTLEESESAEFQVRDGRWGTITEPLGRTPNHMNAFARNLVGDAVLVGTDGGQPAISVAVYSVDEGAWTAVDTLTFPGAVNTLWGNQAVNLDSETRAVLGWFSTTSAGWYRFTPQGGWEDVGTLPAVPLVALKSDGHATATWTQNGALDSRVVDVSTGAVEPVAPVRAESDALGYPRLVACRERVAYLALKPGGSGHEISVTWQDGSRWGSPEPLATATEIRGWVVESDEQGNAVLMWTQADQIWSRIYQYASDAWTRPMLVTTATTDAFVGNIHMVSGNVTTTLYWDSSAYAALYQRDVGWVQNSFVDVTDLGWGDSPDSFGVEPTMDQRGNVLAIGYTGYRRYVPGQGWLASVDHDLELGRWRLWTAPARDGSILVVTHGVLSDDRLFPRVVRFE